MTYERQTAMLVKVDRYSWYFFILWFAVAMVLNFVDAPAGHMMTFGGVILILANNFVRLIIVAEQFRAPGKGKYRALGYLLILALASAVGMQFIIRGGK
jgi:hypothetical protein